MSRRQITQFLLLIALVSWGIPSWAGGKSRGWLGVALKMEPAKNIPKNRRQPRVLIDHVFKKSPAERAGLRRGDAIIAISGVPMKRVDDVIRAIGAQRAKRVVVIELIRDSRPLDVNVQLGSRPAHETLLKRAWLNQSFPMKARFLDHATDRRVALNALKGRPIIVKVWSTTCGPCTLARPQLIDLKKKFAKQSLAVVGMSLESKATIAAYLKRKRVHAHAIWRDPEAHIARTLRVSSRPTFFFIDPKGIVRGIQIGLASDEKMRAMTRRIAVAKPRKKEHKR